MGNVPDTQIADILGGTAQAIHADLLRARALVRRQIMLSGGFFPASTEGNETAPAQFRACKSYLSTLSAATDGLCTSEEKRALSAHLAECPGCRGYYGAMSAIHHGLAVMKHEVPGDMASYIIHRIQQESGPGDFSANSGKQKKRWHFRPAIGRFTIIGLCLALVLLAYSGGILERGQAQLPPPQQNQDQTLPQQANENETTALQQPDSTPEDLPPAQPPFNRRKHPQTTTKQQSRPAERVQLRKTAAAPLSRAAASAIRWFPPEKPIAPYIPRMPLPPASLPNTAPSRSPLHWRMAFRQYITSSRPSRQKASPLRFRKPAFPAAPTQKILPFSAVHRKRSCISFWTKPVS